MNLPTGRVMGYIVRVNKKLSQSDISNIELSGLKIEYLSEILPIIIVRGNEEEILKFSFVTGYREEGIIELEAISVIPYIDEKYLRTKGYVGWNTVIAVIDSGINNLVGALKIVETNDYVDTYSGNGEDSFGHGTTVAQIINNYAPGSQIINIKVTNQKDFLEGKLIRALEWVYKNPKMHIINLSLGARRETQCDGSCELCKLASMLSAKGILVVTAAGNNGPDDGTITCPGAEDSTLTVGAITPNKKVAEFSGRGVKGQLKPDMVTSGFTNSPDPRFNNGTSFSTPVVTGIAAAIHNYKPEDLTLKELLCRATKDIKAPINHQGRGMLDIKKLTEALENDKTTSKSI